MRKVLLIDGDIVAYELSASTQRSYQLPDVDTPTVTTDAQAAVRGMVEKIEGWQKSSNADHVIVCLSDDFSNFRKKVLPSYKSHRTGERPVILYDMKDALGDHFEIARWSNLEADDVMGILATEPQTAERRCIVSADKDMATIPGWVWNPLKSNKPVKIEQEDADRWFFKQTLIGDPTDGYKGCPGIGPKTADEILDGCYLERNERVITKGKRAGEIEVKFVKVLDPELPLWDRIVRTYEAKGLTEGDALAQARCAFILRHGYYEDGRVTLWDPAGF
jgi:5'-3' exonuclease